MLELLLYQAEIKVSDRELEDLSKEELLGLVKDMFSSNRALQRESDAIKDTTNSFLAVMGKNNESI